MEIHGDRRQDGRRLGLALLAAYCCVGCGDGDSGCWRVRRTFRRALRVRRTASIIVHPFNMLSVIESRITIRIAGDATLVSEGFTASPGLMCQEE